MSDETLKKPSGRVTDRAHVLKKAFEATNRAATEKEMPGVFTEELWASWARSEAGQQQGALFGLTAFVAAISEELDSEAERRTAWEAKVEHAITELVSNPGMGIDKRSDILGSFPIRRLTDVPVKP